MESQQKIIRVIGFLNLMMLLMTQQVHAQCNQKISGPGGFELKLPKTYNQFFSDSLKKIESSFAFGLAHNNDTALVFIDDDLYIQACLNLSQDILSMDSIGQFNMKTEDIKELKETRRILFKKKGDKLIIIDFGPKKLEGNCPIEFYCRDFSTKKTLVINSSTSVIHWNKNLSRISKKMTRRISKCI